MKLEEIEAQLAALPPVPPPTPDPDQKRAGLERLAHQQRHLIARRNEKVALATPLRQDVANVQAIDAECQAEFATVPPTNRPDDQTWAGWPLHVSLRAIAGTYDVHDAIPLRFPFFEKLRARGYVGPVGEEWNPAASLYGGGKLPIMEARLAALDAEIAQLDEQIAALQA